MAIINKSTNTFTNPLAEVAFSLLLDSIAALPKLGPRTNGISHRDFILSGVLRPLIEAKSGRDALQKWSECYQDLFQKPDFARSSWFGALHAASRLDALITVGKTFRRTAAPCLPDRLAAFPELALYDVWTGDGHWHEASLHDERFPNAEGENLKLPAGHIYFYNHRSGLILHFETCSPGTQEHDMSVLQRKPLDFLHEGSEGSTGTPKTRVAKRTPLIVYDRAAVDFGYWNKSKRSKGIRLITRDKAGLQYNHVKFLSWDEAAPMNSRIISDELVMKDGENWRRIETTRADKSNGETIVILTNDLNLPPGLICALYHRRWDIERAYDDVKNKFHEDKAWASSQVSKSMQGEFIALAWNVLRVLDNELEKQGVANVAEEKRRAERTTTRKEASVKATRQDQAELDKLRHEASATAKAKNTVLDRIKLAKESPELYKARAMRIPVKLIRWFRNMLQNAWPWEKMLQRIKTLYATL